MPAGRQLKGKQRYRFRQRLYRGRKYVPVMHNLNGVGRVTLHTGKYMGVKVEQQSFDHGNSFADRVGVCDDLRSEPFVSSYFLVLKDFPIRVFVFVHSYR